MICVSDDEFNKIDIAADVQYTAVKAKAGANHDFVIEASYVAMRSYNRLKPKGGLGMFDIVTVNKIGSILLLLISIFISYGLINGTMFSIAGGFIILITSLTFSIMFWLYSVKAKESRC